MNYGSVCSGIEAASVAWEPLGWAPAWFAEIEPFPAAVLAHHWPRVQNLGDMTRISAHILRGTIDAPDVLVGGTPCQAFSVAGAREGLSDERGQLTIAFGRLADAIDFRRVRDGKQEAIITWENVPGVLSSQDNAFGCFIALLAGEEQEIEPGPRPEQGRSSAFWRWQAKAHSHAPKWPKSGCVIGPQRTVAWRILDAQYFGVAQRRRRVFVVASARAGFDPAAVLFESDSVRRDTAPRREAGEGFAADVVPSLTASGRGVERVGESRGQDPVVAVSNAEGSKGLPFLTSSNIGKSVNNQTPLLVHGTQDPCVSDTAFCLGRNSGQENALFHATGAGYWQEGAGTLRARAQDSHENLALGFRACGQDGFTPSPVSPPVLASDGGGSGTPTVMSLCAVRRLTPIECERLQGFPDNHTRIPWRGKPEEDCPDGPRYKAIGNSMAVPVMRWIGERIHMQVAQQQEAA